MSDKYEHTTANAHWIIVETQLTEAYEALANDLHEEFTEFCEQEANNIISSIDNLMRLRPNKRVPEGWSWSFEARVYQPIDTVLWFKLCEQIMKMSLGVSIPLKIVERRFYDVRIEEQIDED